MSAAAVPVRAIAIAPQGPFPNSPLPLLVYPGALTSDIAANELADAFEARFAANRWPPAWRNGIFGYHHFHATAHEALGVYAGCTEVQFGGPSGVTLFVECGDLVVVPAGVAHKNLGDGRGLGIVGAYPHGTVPDSHQPIDTPTVASEPAPTINTVVPDADPFYGPAGPLRGHWSTAS